jgi:hypothetical protein
MLMIRRRSGRKLLTTICSVIAACIYAPTAQAVMITQNGSTVLFSDNFESGTLGAAWDNGAAPGNWTAAITNEVRNASPPGAFEGAQYGYATRTGSGQGIRAQFDPVSTGRLDLNTMVYIPGNQQWLSVALGNNISNNPGTPSGSVHSYVTFHLNATHEVEDGAVATFPKMGFLYKNDEWMKLHVGHDFDNGVGGYTVDLTTSSGTFHYARDIINPGTPINSMLIKFEDNNNSAFFDSPVPEPSALFAMVAGSGLGGLCIRRRRA